MKKLDEINNRIDEGKEFPVNIIKKIQSFTDDNEHNEARILTAKTMKDKKLLSAYEGVEKLHLYFGDLTTELRKIRQQLDKRLFNDVKKKFSNGQDVYMAM